MKQARIPATLILLALCFFSFSSVWAQSYRKNRKHKGFQSEKKEYKIEEVQKRKKTEVVEKKQGPMQLQAFERFTQERLQQKTQEQIDTLNQIISSTPTESRADLYFRLAEHYWENSRYYDFIGHRYDDYRNRPDWPEKSRLQKQAWATSKEYKRRAATVYYQIINNYPNYNRLCEAYYFLGKNLFEMGEQKKALNVFRPMLARFKYPACPFIPNAYLSYGEYYFNSGQVRTALGSYEQVLNFTDTSIYGFAMYKIAWCHYNLVNYKMALKKFVDVINHARNNTENYRSNQSRRIALMKEARRDLVLAYSQINEAAYAQDARRFFLEIGGEKHYLDMLETLGMLYRQQGKMENAIIVYTELMRLRAGEEKTLFYQFYITQAVDRSGTKADTIRETFKLTGMIEDFRKNNKTDKVYKEAITEIMPQIQEFAKYRLYEAQKTRTLLFFSESSEFFKAYLQVFDQEKDAYEMRFWYAEILYRLRRYEEAAKQYQLCLRANPKGKFSRDSAYNVILSYNFLMQRSRLDISNMTTKKTIEKQPLPPIAHKFLEACEEYIRYFPTSSQAIDVSYKAALLYYYFNHFEKALPRFYFLVQKYPSHEYAIYSAHFILDTYNLQKDWSKLSEAAWKFYRTPSLGNPKFKKELRDLIIESGFKICEGVSSQQKPKEAAECYHNLAKEFPDNQRIAAQALFNESLERYKAKMPEEALRARLALIERYPRSQFYQKSILNIADLYADRADFENAAKYYETYIQKFPRDPKYWEYVLQSALFREAMGDKTTAYSYYERALRDKKFRPKYPKEFIALYLKVAQQYKENGNFSRYARMMKEFDTKRYGEYPQRLHARMEYAVSRKRLGFRSEAEGIFKRIPSAYDSLNNEQKSGHPQAGYAAAHVRFMQAEELFKEYEKIRPGRSLDKKALNKALKEKTDAFKKAFKAYEVVIKYKQGDWGVAAYYRAGDLYYNFSQFFNNAPSPDPKEIRQETIKLVRKNITNSLRKQHNTRYIPPQILNKIMRSPRVQEIVNNLVQKIIDKHKEGMQMQSGPLEDKAMEQYQRCLRMAHQLRVYNVWTDRALKRLQSMQPAKFPQQIESRPQAGFASSGFAFVKGTLTPQTAAEQPAPTKGKSVASQDNP